MKIIDSSVYISAFLEEDTNHTKGREILENINEEVVLPYIILSEVITVLVYKHSNELADIFVEYILSDSHFILIDGSVIEDLYFWGHNRKKISFADIICIFLAKKYNAELITFDKEQEKHYLNN